MIFRRLVCEVYCRGDVILDLMAFRNIAAKHPATRPMIQPKIIFTNILGLLGFSGVSARSKGRKESLSLLSLISAL